MAEKKNNNTAALAKMLGNLGVTSSGQTTKKVGSTFRAKNPFAQPTAVAVAAAPVAAAPVAAAATAPSNAALNASDPYNFNCKLQIPFIMMYTSMMSVSKIGEPRRNDLMRFEKGQKQETYLEPLAWAAIRILSQIPHAWTHNLSDPEQTHTAYLINRAAYNNVIATDAVLRTWRLKSQRHAIGFNHNFSIIELKPELKPIAKQLGEKMRAQAASHAEAAPAGSRGGKQNRSKRKAHKKRVTRKNRR